MKKHLLLVLFAVSIQGICQNLDVVGGYFPYWRSTSDVKFENYNYLYYAFVFSKEDGGLKFNNSGESAMTNFLAATNNLNSKRLISVGGTDMDKMANDPVARKHFADTIREFCRIHDFDGIDMDWESIDNATDRDNFTSLMKDIKSSIDSTDLEFVITVGFGNYWQQWYENEALDLADFLQIMIYDQTGTWAASPYGNHASMDHFKQAESYWVGRGYDRNQLVMGLPYYGYRFNNTNGGIADAITYGEFLDQFPNAKASDNLLIDGTGHYFVNGPDLIKEKASYAIDKGFKGVFVWELAQDDYKHTLSLDKALMEVVNSELVSEDYPILNSGIVFPNPVLDELNLKVDDLEKILNISIYSSSGQLVNVFEKSNQVNVSSLKIGMYLLEISHQDGQKEYVKFMKK